MSSIKERVITAAAGLSLIAFAQPCERNSKEVKTPTFVPTIEKTHVPTSTPEPTATAITFPIEISPDGTFIPNINVVATNQKPQDFEEDQKCGVLLNIGQKARIKFPFPKDQASENLTVAFDLAFEKREDGYYFADVKIEGESYISFSMPNFILLIGKIVQIDSQRAFFMPDKDRPFKVSGCAVDQLAPPSTPQVS